MLKLDAAGLLYQNRPRIYITQEAMMQFVPFFLLLPVLGGYGINPGLGFEE